MDIIIQPLILEQDVSFILDLGYKHTVIQPARKSNYMVRVKSTTSNNNFWRLSLQDKNNNDKLNLYAHSYQEQCNQTYRIVR